MDTKTTSWVAYIGLPGFLIAYLAGDKEGAKFHLNQALVIMIFSFIAGFISGILSLIPVLGLIVSLLTSIAVLIVWVLGLVAAINQEEKEVPILGQIKILK